MNQDETETEILEIT